MTDHDLIDAAAALLHGHLRNTGITSELNLQGWLMCSQPAPRRGRPT